MTERIVLGPLCKKLNEQLSKRQASGSMGRVENLVGKTIHQAIPVYEEDYPGTGDGIALTFTDGTYVMLPSDFPEEICTEVYIHQSNYKTDLQLLRNMCVITDTDVEDLLTDIESATEKANAAKLAEKVRSISSKLTAKEKSLLLKQLQGELK